MVGGPAVDGGQYTSVALSVKDPMDLASNENNGGRDDNGHDGKRGGDRITVVCHSL